MDVADDDEFQWILLWGILLVVWDADADDDDNDDDDNDDDVDDDVDDVDDDIRWRRDEVIWLLRCAKRGVGPKKESSRE